MAEEARTGMGQKIREGRERAGLSQEALAERLGVSRQAVSKWEMEGSVPGPENLRALSELLDIQLTQQPERTRQTPGQEGWKKLALGSLLACLVLLGAVIWLAAGENTPEAEADERVPSEVQTGEADGPSITDVIFLTARASGSIRTWGTTGSTLSRAARC